MRKNVDTTKNKTDFLISPILVIKQKSSSLLSKLNEDTEAYEMVLSKVEDRITQLCFQEKTENQKETIKQLEQTFGGGTHPRIVELSRFC